MSMYQKGEPYQVDLSSEDTVYICRCGHTNTAPFCDGSHNDHPPAQPLEYTASEAESIWVCGCGKSGNKPFCDGTHKK